MSKPAAEPLIVKNRRATFDYDIADRYEAGIALVGSEVKSMRDGKVDVTDAYVSIDYQKRHGTVIRRGGNIDAVRQAVARIRNGQVEDLSQLNYQDLVHMEELSIDDVEPLRAELDAFVDAVRKGSKPIVTAQDGLHAVEVAERIVRTIGPPTLA